MLLTIGRSSVAEQKFTGQKQNGSKIKRLKRRFDLPQ
jgi:hypothetical protein